VEEWRTISDFPDYEVSNLGRVRSWINPKRNRRDEPKLLRLYENRQGYHTVDLSNRVSRKIRTVHRLVLSAFVGECPPGMEACHNDGRRSNNVLSNLRWDTPSNNQRDRVAHGTANVGAANPMSRERKAQRA